MTGHLVIGYIHPDFVRAEFMRSMLQTMRRTKTPIDAVLSLKTGPLIASARNDLVSLFLNEHRADWLLMIDTDMVWSPESVDRLVETAEEKELPILGALAYTERQEDGEYLATAFELVVRDGQPQFANYKTWPEDSVFPVAGTGAAFLLVHREAFRKIAGGWGDNQDTLWPWFREGNLAGKRRLGEDLNFCLRAQAAGLKVNIHTGIQVGHMKSAMLGKVS